MIEKNLMSSAAIPEHAGTGQNEVEQERLELIRDANLNEDDRKDFTDPDGFPMHELWDRLGIANETFDGIILSHPSTFLNQAWFTKAHKISTLITELHDEIGKAHTESVDDDDE